VTPPFGQFIGNPGSVAFLRTSLVAGRLAHAYVITGPPQIGKRTLSRLVAAGSICPHLKAHSGPCGECRSCRLVEKDSHPDVRTVSPEPGKRSVTIEQVRQLEHDAVLRPYEAERKVFILRAADAMAEPAANALLKTLEEPPEDTILILIATDAAQLLPTIASRCREVALRPVPPEEIEAALRARGAVEDRARLLSRLAGGRPGWAIEALADPARLAARAEQVEQLGQPRVARLSVAGAFTDAAAARAAMDVWLGWWRDALLVQQDCVDLVANTDRLESLRRLGASQPPEHVWRALARLQEARQQIDANANVRLAVEALLLDLPEASTTASREA
jgi:DNA polymerase III subunit delta'